MRKKTTMGLVISTILIAYISALTLPNQAFAQPPPAGGFTLFVSNVVQGGLLGGHPGLLGGNKAISGNHSVEAQLGQVLAGHGTQLGQILTGHGTQLGESPNIGCLGASHNLGGEFVVSGGVTYSCDQGR